jgi:ribose transport system permease protein
LLHGDGFLGPSNLLNIFRQTATISVIAVAMTLVIACAEIDLSVGGVAGLSSVVVAITIRDHGAIAGVLAGIGVGLLIGAANGLLVSHRHSKLPGYACNARCGSWNCSPYN